MRLHYLIIITLLVLSVSAQPGNASEFEIRYVSGKKVGISMGDLSGLGENDRIAVLGDDGIQAILRIELLTGDSAWCRLDSGSVGPGSFYTLAGGRIIKAKAQTEHKADHSVQARNRQTVTTNSISQPRKGPMNVFSGKATFRNKAQIDFRKSDRTYIQPSAVIKGDIKKFLGTGNRIIFRLGGRRTLYSSNLTGAGNTQWDNEFGELTIMSDRPGADLNYRIGRVRSSSVRGLGLMDGVLLSYRINFKTHIGGFSGFEYDPVTSEPDLSAIRTGMFIGRIKESLSGHRREASLALLGTVQQGSLKRPGLYQQIGYSYLNRFLVHESAEVLFSDYRENYSGSNTGIVSNLVLEFRYVPHKRIELSFAMDNRASDRVWIQDDTPDTLFDDSALRGLRYGLLFKPSATCLMRLGGSYRTFSGTSNQATTAYSSFSLFNVLSSRITTTGRIGVFNTSWTNGIRPSLRFSRRINQTVYTVLEAGERIFSKSGLRQVNYWCLSRLNWRISRVLSSSLLVEWTEGDTENSSRLLIEFGYWIR